MKRSSSSLSDDDSNFASRFFFVLSFVMAPARPVAQGLPHGPSPRASRRRHAHRHRLPSLARPLLWGADVGQREIGLHDCVYDRGACARARTRNQGEPEVPPGGTWRSSTLRAATHWTGGARASSLPRPPPSRPHSVPRTGFAQGRVQWGATRRRRERRSAPRPSREGPRRPLACSSAPASPASRRALRRQRRRPRARRDGRRSGRSGGGACRGEVRRSRARARMPMPRAQASCCPTRALRRRARHAGPAPGRAA